jgi:PGF-CTERM protein
MMVLLCMAAFVCGTAGAATIYVPDDQGTIQAAVTAANPYDTIIVRDGIYHENVDVGKQLTIRSENGAAVTTVTAVDMGDHVFEVTVDYVNISGFNVAGATDSSKAGFYLSDRQHCNISNNNAAGNNKGIYLLSSSNNTLTSNTANSNYGSGWELGGNGYGIYLYYSSNNTITSNTASNNIGYGIYLYYSSNNNTLTNNTANSNTNYGILLHYLSNNTLTSNNADSNNYGIGLYSSSNNTLTGNTASNNTNYGIYLSSSSNNTIYNNYFNNTYNAYDDGNNTWNTTPTTGTNIIGGSWLGGNYWSDYAGADTNGDDLGDTLTPYNSSGNITFGGDYHPLVTPSSVTPTPSSGGGEGTYPPGWHETPTATVTATKAPTPSATATATDAPPGERVTPAATKVKPAAAKAAAPAAEGTTAGTAKKDAPGFTAVFVIAGVLAVAYAMMWRRS